MVKALFFLYNTLEIMLMFVFLHVFPPQFYIFHIYDMEFMNFPFISSVFLLF